MTTRWLQTQNPKLAFRIDEIVAIISEGEQVLLRVNCGDTYYVDLTFDEAISAVDRSKWIEVEQPNGGRLALNVKKIVSILGEEDRVAVRTANKDAYYLDMTYNEIMCKIGGQ